MGSVRMCRSRAELDPVFRWRMFVINGSCPSSFLALRRASRTDSAGRKGGAVQVGADGERRLARDPAEQAPVVAPIGG
jgi:hypothetical protein